MANDKYLEFLECAKGLYKQGLDLLDPEKEDVSILSGCILLTIGLEKLIKHVLESRNPLMILGKVTFKDIVDVEKGLRVGNRQTVSLSIAFERLTYLFPQLEQEKHYVLKIIKDRNFLVHQAGYFNIAKTEGRVRVNITNISEQICLRCIDKKPEEIFVEGIWDKMVSYREAYREAEVLELNKRIAFLKRIYSQGEKLPCEQVELSEKLGKVEYECPICSNMAEIEIEVDKDWDYHDMVLLGGCPYLSRFKCKECGFTLSDPDEIEALVGEEAARELLYPSYGEREY
jgi:hypothetical protein